MSEEIKFNSREGDAPPPKLHAIQLMAVQPIELSIKVKGDPASVESFEGYLKLEVAHSAYDGEKKTIHVRTRSVIEDQDDVPLSMTVEIVGVFKVDEERFDKTHIVRWATYNAPMVLYPYLRELVFSLSQRVGARGLIFPLIEVPTFRVISPSK